MSSSMGQEVQLSEVCGIHLTNVALMDTLADALSALDGDIVCLSFSGVRSLSPSCATTLVLAVQTFKSSRPGVRVTFTDLTVAHRQALERSRAVLGV